MSDYHDPIELLRSMSHSEVRNYIAPGVTSMLIGDGMKLGQVRMFESTRDFNEFIVPHSHRFDFACLVVRGHVRNTIFTPCAPHLGELYGPGELRGKLGVYETIPAEEPMHFDKCSSDYKRGDWYGMTHDEIHSIHFDHDAVVLFFEGPDKTDKTTFLEPWAYGKRVPTFKVEPWMFEKVGTWDAPTRAMVEHVMRHEMNRANESQKEILELLDFVETEVKGLVDVPRRDGESATEWIARAFAAVKHFATT